MGQYINGFFVVAIMVFLTGLTLIVVALLVMWKLSDERTSAAERAEIRRRIARIC